MKTVTFILSLTLSLSYSFAQETKFVQKRGDGGINEEYYVLTSDKKIKHGSYVKYKEASVFDRLGLLESGSYKNGEKDGLWTYFYNQAYSKRKSATQDVKTKGHYVNGKRNGVWIYYYRDTVLNPVELSSYGNKRQKDSVVLEINHAAQKIQLVGSYLNDKRIGEWTYFDYKGNVLQKYNFSKRKLLVDVSIKDTATFNKNRKPLFIGGESSLTRFLAGDFETIGVSKDIQKDSISVTVSFVVTKDGKVSNCYIDQSNASKESEKECVRVIQLTDLWWIPATSVQGEPIESIYKFRFRFFFKKKSGPSTIEVEMKLSSV